MSFTVTITGVSAPVEVYADETTTVADYINAMMGDAPAAWANLTADGAIGLFTRRRAMVLASRLIDAQDWQGAATLVGTTLQWPRTNVINADGSAVSSVTVPAAIVKAFCELVALLCLDPALYTQRDQASNVQAIGVGPSRLQFFEPITNATGLARALPETVDRLVGQWLASGLPPTVLGGANYGGQIVNPDGTVSEDSYFEPEDQNLRNWPF